MFTIFSYKINEKHILISILLLAALLRFSWLGAGEFFHDEGFLNFRSIGYLDYIQSDDQTTPIQWFKDAPFLPWWTSLSFHDHPPLFFLIQNISFKIFGISLFAARFPSALAGTFSVYLLYLISRKNFKNALLAFLPPLLFSVNLIHLWISRSSLMESVQVFFILWNIYLFFRFLEDRRRWKLFGITLGFCFLTKYTSAFLIPVYFSYLILDLIFRKPDSLNRGIPPVKDSRLYAAFGLSAAVFSPVLIFNFYLWQIVGHFDLQFAYLFHQLTPEWRVSLGKIQDPFSEIFSNLSLIYSFPFLSAAVAGIGYAVYSAYKRQRINSQDENSMIVFWLLNIIFITLMLTAVGSAFRFIILYAAPAIMLITFLIDYLLSRLTKKEFLLILALIFAAYELFFASDIFFAFPDFGIVKLDNYLNEQLGDKRSVSIPASPNLHLNNIIKSRAIKISPGDKSKAVIYDGNIGLSPRLWLFTRRNYYLGIPAFNVDQFKNFLKEGYLEKFHGFEMYFVKTEKNTILNPLFQNSSALELENFLTQQLNLSPVKLIIGKNGSLMFTVYKFSL